MMEHRKKLIDSVVVKIDKDPTDGAAVYDTQFYQRQLVKISKED